MAKARKFLKLEIDPATREEFEALYTRRGLTQIQAGTRVFEWFMAQDEIVQQAIFQQLPESLMGEARRQLLEGVTQASIATRRGGVAEEVLPNLGRTLRGEPVPDEAPKPPERRKRTG